MRSPLRMLVAVLVATIALTAAAGSALAAAPVNDDFSNATQLSGNRGSVDFDLTEATHQTGEPALGGATDRTVWFRYTPSQTGIASFSTCRPETDLVMDGGSIAVYTGSTLSGLTAGPASTDGCLNGRVNATITGLSVTAGQTYRVQLAVSVDSMVTGGAMAYDFNTAVPTNDDFTDARPITGSFPQTLAADNGLATVEDTEPQIENDGPRNSLWWKWTPDHDGVIWLDTCAPGAEADADSRIHLYSDGDPDPDVTSPTPVAENDDGCASPRTLLSALSNYVVGGETYFIRVSNFNNNFGAALKLNLHWITDPELAAKPRVAPSNSRLRVGESAYGVVGDWLADPAVDSNDFEWKRCDSAGENCAMIDGETDSVYAIQAVDVGHRLVFTTNAHRGASDYSEDSEPSTLVDDVPSNDDLDNATTLSSTAPVSVTDDNYFATLEADENDDATQPLSQSVWYRWTAPQSKAYFVDGCDSAESSQFAVNVFADGGGGIPTLTAANQFDGGCPEGGNYSRTFFTAAQGATYLIQAGSLEDSGAMEFTLGIHEVPAPSFDSAAAIAGVAIEQSTLSVSYAAESSAITANESVAWSLCDSAGANCSAINDASGNNILITGAMVGKRLKATVTLANSNGSISTSALSGVIAALPVVNPPGGGTTTQPPVTPADPFSRPSIPKSLGKSKLSKKSTITLSKLNFLCGETATGPCTGTLTFTTAKVKKNGKTIKSVKYVIKLSVRPGRTMPTTYKLSTSMVKAVKAAKSLKTSIAIKLGAPGFSQKTVATGVTVSLK